MINNKLFVNAFKKIKYSIKSYMFIEKLNSQDLYLNSTHYIHLLF